MCTDAELAELDNKLSGSWVTSKKLGELGDRRARAVRGVLLSLFTKLGEVAKLESSSVEAVCLALGGPRAKSLSPPPDVTDDPVLLRVATAVNGALHASNRKDALQLLSLVVDIVPEQQLQALCSDPNREPTLGDNVEVLMGTKWRPGVCTAVLEQGLTGEPSFRVHIGKEELVFDREHVRPASGAFVSRSMLNQAKQNRRLLGPGVRPEPPSRQSVARVGWDLRHHLAEFLDGHTTQLDSRTQHRTGAV